MKGKRIFAVKGRKSEKAEQGVKKNELAELALNQLADLFLLDSNKHTSKTEYTKLLPVLEWLTLKQGKWYGEVLSRGIQEGDL